MTQLHQIQTTIVTILILVVPLRASTRSPVVPKTETQKPVDRRIEETDPGDAKETTAERPQVKIMAELIKVTDVQVTTTATNPAKPLHLAVIEDDLLLAMIEEDDDLLLMTIVEEDLLLAVVEENLLREMVEEDILLTVAEEDLHKDTRRVGDVAMNNPHVNRIRANNIGHRLQHSPGHEGQ